MFVRDFRKPETGSKGDTCPHCRKKETLTGTHGGCLECGKVKHTSSGKIKRYIE